MKAGESSKRREGGLGREEQSTHTAPIINLRLESLSISIACFRGAPIVHRVEGSHLARQRLKHGLYAPALTPPPQAKSGNLESYGWRWPRWRSAYNHHDQMPEKKIPKAERSKGLAQGDAATVRDPSFCGRDGGRSEMESSPSLILVVL
ncbi:hypothetical protein IE53DRAFT_131152 [Violaceomyces palustris]|uniref:Uncharacterized protein n=1 Tax=Violaceomyces palustris TaxID=1673888 RepID=A0ACD0NVB3_9BASI|nr:hypothetical protein IE53DRAFT_131152 [Violaceomyces palustris]